MRRADSEPLKALVVDDEPLARDQMRRLLAAHGGVTILAECERGDSAAQAIMRMRLDVVFLDVQMPGLDGLGVVARVGADRMPATVFVTAFAHHAVDALRIAAVDYLIKPVDPDELRLAITRVRKKLAEPSSLAFTTIGGLTRVTSPYVRRLVAKNQGRMVVIDVDQVDRIEASRNYVVVHYAKTRTAMRATLSEIAERLDPERFARVHRSTIVNLARVREVQPWLRGEYIAILFDGCRVPVGSSFRDGFLRRLKGG